MAKLEMARARQTLTMVQLKLKEAQLAGVVKKEHLEMVEIAQENLDAQKEIVKAAEQNTKETIKHADAIFENKKKMAEFVFEQDIAKAIQDDMNRNQEKLNGGIEEGTRAMNGLKNAASGAAGAIAGAANEMSRLNAQAAQGATTLAELAASVWHGDKQYDKYKLDDNGNIVLTTDEERRRQMNQALLPEQMLRQEQMLGIT